MPLRAISLLLPGLAFFFLAQACLAQAPPLADGDYRIDLYGGPVLGSTRVVGLAGAYAALAEKTVGLPFNAASAANRTTYSDTRFDWGLGYDFLFPGTFRKDHFDFDNNGRSLRRNTSLLELAGLIQWGSFGLGLRVRGQSNQFQDDVSPPRIFEAGMGTFQFTGGYGLFDHQLVFGTGLRIGYFNVHESGEGENAFSATTVGTDFGLLLRPQAWPVRLGASLLVPLTSEVSLDEEPGTLPSLFLPEKGIAIPVELRLGGAVLFGKRAWNALPEAFRPAAPSRPEAEETEEEAKPEPYLDAFYVLLSAEIVIWGAVRDAVGIDGFLQQIEERSGRVPTCSVRLGAETEVWPDQLRLRGGTYWEPSRFEDYPGRLHVTFGLEARLFEVHFLGHYTLNFSAAVDFAQRYSNISLSIGFWH